MRIVFLLDRLNLGGAERHTMTLAAALAARGHQVTTVVLLANGSAAFPIEGFPEPPLQLQGRSVASPRMLRALAVLLRRKRPDLVFAVNQSTLVTASVLRSFGVPMPRLACIFHTTVITSRLGLLKLRLFKFCTARSDALIFVSRLQREYWRAKGMRARRILAIQNGIDADRFAPALAPARAEMRRRFGLADTDVALVLVGRLAVEKNHGWLLQEVANMRQMAAETAPRIRPVFIGEGPLLAELQQRAQRLGVQDLVIFAGAFTDVAPILALGDVGVLVSNAVETLSLAALELMAAGLPMIMTETGGAAEILQDRKQGMLIGIGDAAALRHAITALANPQLRAVLGQAARQRVLGQFTLTKMVNAYEAFVQEAGP